MLLFYTLSDSMKVPLDEIKFLPDSAGIERMTSWKEVSVAKIITSHCPGFSKYRKYIRLDGLLR